MHAFFEAHAAIMPLMIEMITTTDIAILHAIHDALHGPVLDVIMTFFTRLGDAGFVWLVIAAVLLMSKRYRAVGLAVLLALAIEFVLVNIGLKNLTARPRPFLIDPTLATDLINLPQSHSFPSGHTGSSFAAAVALLYFPWKRAWMRALPIGLAALVSFSRLYLGVHYPSDVFAGMLIGIACGIAGYHLAQAIIRKRRSSSRQTKNHS